MSIRVIVIDEKTASIHERWVEDGGPDVGLHVDGELAECINFRLFFWSVAKDTEVGGWQLRGPVVLTGGTDGDGITLGLDPSVTPERVLGRIACLLRPIEDMPSTILTAFEKIQIKIVTSDEFDALRAEAS